MICQKLVGGTTTLDTSLEAFEIRHHMAPIRGRGSLRKCLSHLLRFQRQRLELPRFGYHTWNAPSLPRSYFLKAYLQHAMAVHGAGSTNTNANADDNSARGPPSPSSGRRRSLNRLNPPRLRVAIDGATGAAAGAATPPPANGRSNIHTYRLAKALFDYFYAQPKEGGSDKEGRNQPSLASALSFEGAWWTYIDVRRLLPGCPSFLEAIHDHQCVLPLPRHSFVVL